MRWLCAFALVLALAVAVPVLRAGEGGGGAPAAEAPEESKLPQGPIELIICSGFFGWVLCVLSVVSLAMSIECFMNVKREKMIPEGLLADVEAALDNGEYEEAMNICQSEDCFFTRIMNAGFNKMSLGFERMSEAMAEEADTQATLLFQKLGWLNLIAGLAPMLGLLGTVQGMVGAFGEIATNPQATAADLGGGIYVALMTTMEGLVVAIPTTVFFAFLRVRAVRVTMAMGTVMGEILDRFRPQPEQ